MKKYLKLFAVSLFLILSFSSFAQSKNEDNENRKKWHEEFRLKKQEFLIKNLDQIVRAHV